jgi:hypothetical protein
MSCINAMQMPSKKRDLVALLFSARAKILRGVVAA